MMLVEFYTAKAERLDAQAAEYEGAAAAHRNGPKIKNLLSPTTAGQYEFFAKRLRDEAESDWALVAAHERMVLIANR
jgi:hypothetical protein